MGKNITRVGDIGAGQICKVANQIKVALNIAALSEALVFASKAGTDPVKVRQALMGGFAASRTLEVHGERMIKRTFNPGFRIALHQKDLNLALQSARALDMALPQTAMAAQLMQSKRSINPVPCFRKPAVIGFPAAIVRRGDAHCAGSAIRQGSSAS